ncbi:hypothetical protein [Clostridium sp. KNHs214]|uniref:hypothetical protein n=1 Tax=Clostridium sp. KNHs214 TaxID=1540257 RepID=UPI0005593B11|nr:hypothetical protein [Clostridium sp. KNHs214]
MQVLIMVLNKTNYLEDIIKEFNNCGIRGATIIESTGMAEILTSCGEEIPMFGSLKMLLNEKRPFNKTIFTVLKDEQVKIAVDAIKNVVGDLKKPGVGILFTLPINFVEGVSF